MKQRFWGLRGSKLHLEIWIEACVGIMIFGYNHGAAGAVLNNVAFNAQFPQKNTATTTGVERQHNSTIQGTVVALYVLLGVFGCVACVFAGDLLGRRKTILIAGVVNGIGVIIQSTAFTLGQLIVGRIFLGLGTGGIVATASLW